jgi:hypothetical protein
MSECWEWKSKSPTFFLRPPFHCISVISNCILPGTSLIGAVKGLENKFIDFSFDLKSELFTEFSH